MEEVVEISLGSIYWPDPTDVTEDQIKNMAASILIHGLVEPIIVAAPENGKYRGVCGRLRYEGMKNRWRGEPEGKTILARVHSFKGEMEIKMWQLAENLHRREISAMQRARQMKDLYDVIRKETNEEVTLQSLASTIQDMTGDKESIKTIQHYLSLVKIEPKAQEILTSEKMPLRYGLEVLRIKSPEKQVKAAKEISERSKPDYQGWKMRNVDDVKQFVDSVLVDERRDRQELRLRKKAEELKAGGKIVYIDGELSYSEKDKKIRSFQYTLTPMPEECKDCPNLGIELQRNFHPEPICTDPKCYEKKYQEKTQSQKRKQEEDTREWREEKAKVYEMEPDIRHWRLVVLALIDDWELKDLLDIKGWTPGRGGAVLDKVQTLNEEECKRLLIESAVKKVLTLPQSSWGAGDLAKEWTVKQFGLKPELFLQKDEGS